jgi:hypothetical protein
MYMKQTISAMSILLLSFAAAAAAPGKNGAQAGQPQANEHGTQIIIRSEAEKKRRADENSNRQSGLDASRGLERAGERRNGDKQGEKQDGDSTWWWPFD